MWQRNKSRSGGKADALRSGRSVLKDVRVQIPPSALLGFMRLWLSRIERSPAEAEAAGSNPARRATFIWRGTNEGSPTQHFPLFGKGRAVSSVVRAPVLHTGGQRFKSSTAHQQKLNLHTFGSFNCHPERQRRASRRRPEHDEGFFAELVLSEILRSLPSLRMTGSEGLRMTDRLLNSSYAFGLNQVSNNRYYSHYNKITAHQVIEDFGEDHYYNTGVG